MSKLLKECENFFMDPKKGKREKRTLLITQIKTFYTLELRMYTWRPCRHRPVCNVMKEDQFGGSRNIIISEEELGSVENIREIAQQFEADLVILDASKNRDL